MRQAPSLPRYVTEQSLPRTGGPAQAGAKLFVQSSILSATLRAVALARRSLSSRLHSPRTDPPWARSLRLCCNFRSAAFAGTVHSGKG
jgi:hypothetical protein